MADRMRDRLRPWLPPAAIRLWHQRRGTGSSLRLTDLEWDDLALTGATYGDPVILAHVEEAAEAALSDRGRFERDGVVFREKETHWPVLGPLFEARAALEGPLKVIDYGGSLASKWIQHRDFLPALAPMSWAVVEQEHFVGAGQRLFESTDVTFHMSIESAVRAMNGVDVIIFSSSLQYLRDPMMVLSQAANLAAHAVVLDRTPSWSRPAAHLALQQVGLYDRPVQYPCWILSRPAILAQLRHSFTLVSTWNEALPIPTSPYALEVDLLGASGIGRVK